MTGATSIFSKVGEVQEVSNVVGIGGCIVNAFNKPIHRDEVVPSLNNSKMLEKRAFEGETTRVRLPLFCRDPSRFQILLLVRGCARSVAANMYYYPIGGD